MTVQSLSGRTHRTPASGTVGGDTRPLLGPLHTRRRSPTLPVRLPSFRVVSRMDLKEEPVFHDVRSLLELPPGYHKGVGRHLSPLL